MTPPALKTTVGLSHLTVNGNPDDPAVLDLRPIELPGFRLRAFGADILGQPTPEQAANALLVAEAMEESSPYWVGDILVYLDTLAETSPWLAARVPQLRKMARQTQENLKSVSRRVGMVARQLAQSKSHAAEVAAVAPAAQERWLERSRTEGWTERELRHAIRHAARSTVIEGQADTMHTVDVTVQVDVEAQTPVVAEDKAWDLVKRALNAFHLQRSGKVLASHARPR